ncbi:MAG: methyltransferase [Chloroflexota bacterium]
MTELEFFNRLIVTWLGLAVIVFIVLLRWPAPYGRHVRRGWGPAISTRTGWVVMEAPAVLWFMLWYSLSSGVGSLTATVFLVMWQAHYLHRAFVYPLTLQSAERRMPLAVVAMAVLFNTVNAYINGRFVFTLSDGYPVTWLTDVRFVVGFALFVVGYVVNRRSDWLLRERRTVSGTQYCRIDEGLFRYVCCPNYLGELLIWTGWAIATWSLAGLSFAVWTAANLLPRARTHLRWCREYWDDYPQDRKAVLPGLW